MVRTRIKLAGYDSYLLFITVLIAGTGIVMLYSASSAIGDEIGDSATYLKGHFIRLLLGFMLLLITKHVDYHRYRKYAGVIIGAALGIVIFGFIYHKFGGRGVTSRWIYIAGMSFQTSEFLKFALIVFAAAYIERKKALIASFNDGFLPLVILLVVSTALVLLQPDLSTSVILVAIVLVMAFIGGTRLSHIFSVGSVGMLIGVVSLFNSSYQLSRVKTFLSGGDSSGAGYQIHQSILSLGGGGFLGRGLGDSIGKNLFLPTPHTDFILAIIGEEMGFLGVFFIAVMFLLLFFRGMKIARSATDPFGMLLAIGISTSIFLYAMVNAAVVSGLIPVTGLPMPLISYGGSNVLYTLGSIGVLLNISTCGKVPSSRRYRRNCG